MPPPPFARLTTPPRRGGEDRRRDSARGPGTSAGGALAAALLVAATAPPAVDAQADPADTVVELRPLPDASVRFLDYRPAPALELLGDSAVVLLDFDARQVEVRSLDDGTARRFGREGQGPGEFVAVADVAVGPGGGIFVGDVPARRVSEFDVDGTLRATHPIDGVVLQVMATGDAVFAGWVPATTFLTGDGPRITRIVPDTGSSPATVVPADADPGWPEPPDEAPETVAFFPMTAGGELVFAAHPYVYRIAAFGPSGEAVASFGRDVELQRPDEAEIQEAEERIDDLRERGGPPLSTGNVERMKEMLRDQAKPFFAPSMLEADEGGGLWVATTLRTPGDSSRVDYFPPGTRAHRSFHLRDRVTALAASRHRLVALVARRGPEALGRFGLDVYEIRRGPAGR